MKDSSNQSTAVWQRWVLDAIRKIRAQKQRPSVERICHAVRSAHSVPDTSTQEHLEKLVSLGMVLKVFNKGMNTYKDPGGDRARVLEVTRDMDMTKVVVKALRELTEREPEGTNLKTLEKYVQQSNSLCLETGVELSFIIKTALRRALDRGLVVQDKKLYRTVEKANDDTPSTPTKTPKKSLLNKVMELKSLERKAAELAEKSETESPNKDTPKKRKKKKSISESPKKTGLSVCVECLGTCDKNIEGAAEELALCTNCGSGVHPSCLPDPQLFTVLRTKGNSWRCHNCFVCSSCSDTDQVCGFICSSCDRVFHLGCLTCNDKKSKNSWVCVKCLEGAAPPTPPPKPVEPTPRARHANLRIAHLKSLRKAARACLTRKKGSKAKESSCGETEEASSEDGITLNSLTSSELPPGVVPADLEVFRRARDKASELTKIQQALPEDILCGRERGHPPRCPSAIEFGQFLIKTWYSSPFPQEYAKLGKLFLCEFCLKYAKSKAVLHRHLEKCSWRHPPGTEIYRHNNVSIFEVDGNVAKFYCQNLCLLAKLFLDHKTLYYDVEPFLFYVLTSNDDRGFHVVGYFSKEKHCAQKYNVSCIMTLPHYQRKGYGRFLIDFSYLLSKQEGMAGTPEKPLSDLGRVSYLAYWRSVILEYLDLHREIDLSIGQISRDTGLHCEDVTTSLTEMEMLKVLDDRLSLIVDWSEVDTHVARVRHSKSRIPIVEEALRWTPLVPSLTNPYRPPNSQEEDNCESDGRVGSDSEKEEPEEEEDKDQKVDIKRIVSVKLEQSKDQSLKKQKPKKIVKPFGKRRRRKVKTHEQVAMAKAKSLKARNLRQRTLPELFKRGRTGKRAAGETSSSKSVAKPKKIVIKEEPKDVDETPLEEPVETVRKARKVSNESVEQMIKGKRSRRSAVAAVLEESNDSATESPRGRKRRRTDGDLPLVKPCKLKLDKSSSGETPDTPSSPATPKQEKPVHITRAGRVSSLPKTLSAITPLGKRSKQTTSSTPSPATAVAESKVIENKRSLAAKLRWVKRKEGADQRTVTSDSPRKIPVKQLMKKRGKKRRLGRPVSVPDQESEEETSSKKTDEDVEEDEDEDGPDTPDSSGPSSRPGKRVKRPVGRKMKRRRAWVKTSRQKTALPTSTSSPTKEHILSHVLKKSKMEVATPSPAALSKAPQDPVQLPLEPVAKEKLAEEGKPVVPETLPDDEMPQLTKEDIISPAVEIKDLQEESGDTPAPPSIVEQPPDLIPGLVTTQSDVEPLRVEEKPNTEDKGKENLLKMKPLDRYGSDDSGDSSDDSRPPRSDHSRSPSPHHSTADENEEDDMMDSKEDSMKTNTTLPEEQKTEENSDEPVEKKLEERETTPPPQVIEDRTSSPCVEPKPEPVEEDKAMPILEKCDVPVISHEVVKKQETMPPVIKSQETSLPLFSQPSPALEVPPLAPLIPLNMLPSPVEKRHEVPEPVKMEEKKIEENILMKPTMKELEKSIVMESKREDRTRQVEEKREELKQVKHTVEVDLTQDDSPPPLRPEPLTLEPHIKEPPPSKKHEHSIKSERPREVPCPVLTPQPKERPNPVEEKRRDEVLSLKHDMITSVYSAAPPVVCPPRTPVTTRTRTPPVATRTPPVTARTRTPPVQTTMHPMVYSGCNVDVSPASHMAAIDQPVEMSTGSHPYSDCAQQATLHHRSSVPTSVHHMTSGHMVYHHQQEVAAKIQAAARASKQQRQRTPPPQQLRHQVASPQPSQHYHQAAAQYPYMLHRVPASQAGVQATQRLASSCSNFYLGSTSTGTTHQPTSLAKLQQLTNGLDTLPPGATSAWPPGASGGVPPRYNPAQYNPHAGYRTQPAPPSYVTNPNFMNPTQMQQMMNVQSQYSQDPQQNPVYTYPYINNGLIQPLNSTMRR